METWTPLRSYTHFHKHHDGDNVGDLYSELSELKYLRPVSQASLISIKRALIRRKQVSSNRIAESPSGLIMYVTSGYVFYTAKRPGGAKLATADLGGGDGRFPRHGANG